MKEKEGQKNRERSKGNAERRKGKRVLEEEEEEEELAIKRMWLSKRS